MSRPPIPKDLERKVLLESGHRCAIPTCKQTPVVICHIEPWAKVKVHQFENLIALCPTCHSRFDNTKAIDKKSMKAYKAGLKPQEVNESAQKTFKEIGPLAYGGSVIQIGGIGSRIVTKTAWSLDEHGYFNANDCVFTSFNGPGDFMHVCCADGYQIVACKSETDCYIEKLSDTNYGVGILDQLKNSVTIRCERIEH